jgi:hypothetical protein
MRSIAQKRFTAVGRAAANVRQIRSNPSSSERAFSVRAPSAMPIAAATPIAGAPRTTIVRIAVATSRQSR